MKFFSLKIDNKIYTDTDTVTVSNFVGKYISFFLKFRRIVRELFETNLRGDKITNIVISVEDRMLHTKEGLIIERTVELLEKGSQGSPAFLLFIP